MGHAHRYFLIDGDDIAHAVTLRTAEAILDGSVPESVPRCDADGVLLASVGLRLEDGVPSAIGHSPCSLWRRRRSKKGGRSARSGPRLGRTSAERSGRS